MTEREKVLYDVAKLLYAAAFAEDDDVSPKGAWDAAEKFYREMVTRLGEPPEEVGDRTK